mmetsp:Transcript_46714/g.52047  ORF Transcript_46714/g.52047 Transcript_46714/m.52047 type:complete len:3191 (+) Transcript_46714:200-9772(+)
MNTAIESRTKRQKLSSQALWRPLDARQQLHLELIARLLACAQRLHMAREGWDALENPDDTLAGFWKEPGLNNDEEWVDPEAPEIQNVSIQVLVNCPWMSLIIRNLTPSTDCTISNASIMVKLSDVSSTVASFDNPLCSVLKLLEKEETPRCSPIPYLAIIGACAELFPAGECWTSSTMKNWHRFIPKDKFREEVIYCHGSSPFDLTVLLSILLKLLAKHGSPEGDPRVQYWILLTLTKLTETTAVVFQNIESNPRDLLSLTTEWRNIWKTLLRPDLRYVSYANFLGENSLGEILVTLLTGIVSWRCTETLQMNPISVGCRQSSFVYENQNQIWCFLVLESTIFGTDRSRAHFELISSISQLAGLSDSQDRDEKSLRHDLLCLSLKCMKGAFKKQTHSALEYSCKQELMRAVASCIIGLVTGKAFSLSRMTSTDTRFLITKGIDECLSLQQTDNITHSTQSENISEIYLKLLWGYNNENVSLDPNLSLVALYRSKLDFPSLVAKKVRECLKEKEVTTENCVSDFISESESEELRRNAFDFLGKIISNISKESVVSIDSNKNTKLENGTRCLNSSKTGSIKLMLSLLMTRPNTDTDAFDNIHNILSFFVDSISELARVRFEPNEYLQIACDLQQITQALVEIRSCHLSAVNLSRMTESITECQSIMKQYSDDLNSGNPDLASNEQTVNSVNASQNISFDDDDSDSNSESTKNAGDNSSGNFNGQNKRCASGIRAYDRQSKKRRRTQSLIFTPPNYQCAKAIGSILLAMDPSVSNCRLVCESLLGTELDVKPQNVQGDMDLRLGVACIDFLGMKKVLLNSLARQKLLNIDETEEFSPTNMICRAIELLRTCAEPSSRLYMYGNQECAKVAVEKFKLGLRVTDEETTFIMKMMSDEEGMRSRPSLRAQRIEAATFVFENGSEEFHSLFDKFFAKSIVKVGFDDDNILVRRLAYIAAGVALCKLDEQRIINSVNNLTAPITRGSSAQDVIQNFTNWYVKSGFSVTEEQDRLDIEARDSLEVMESDSIFAKTLIAGSTLNMTTFQMILHELLEIPVNRPGLEFMCYRALERIACMRGYPNVLELVDLETEGILVIWLQEIEEKNIGPDKTIFALSLTSPTSVWYIALYGQYNYIYQNQFSPEPNDDSTSFRKQSTGNFVCRYRSFITPFALLRSHDAISKCQSSDSIAEHLSKDLGLKMIVLFLLKYEDENDESVIIRLLRNNVVDIQATILPLLHSDDIAEKKVGQNVLQILVKVLSLNTVESKTNKKTSLLIRRVIHLFGKAESFSETIPTSQISYYKAIMHRMDTASKTQKISGDNFIRVGTSLTEVTIYACNELDKSKLPNHQNNAWSRLTLLGQFLIDQLKCGGGEQIQLDFFLHELKEIALKSSFNNIRPKVLALIDEVLRESLQLNKTELEAEVSSIAKMILGICLHIHEESQQHLLQSCRRKLKNHELDLWRSCGIHLGTNGGSYELDMQPDNLLSDVNLKQEIERCLTSQLDHECLIHTYDIIDLITENRESLGLKSHIFANFSSTFEVNSSNLKILEEFDKRYCAQNLTQGLDVFNSDGLFHQCVIGLKSLTSRPHFFIRENKYGSNDSKNPSDTNTSFEERLLCAELSQVEKALGETRIEEGTSSDFKSLYNVLCCICSASCSLKVRFASSRCMALLQPSAIVDAYGMSSRDKPFSDSNGNGLLLNLQARCIDCLAECLKSSETDISVAAVNTLEALLSNPAGRNASREVATTSRSLINPFISKERSGRVNTTILSKKEIKILTEKVGVQCDNSLNDESMWCWNRKLWAFDDAGSPQFKLWIRHVTAAIIFCCFDYRGKKTVNGKSPECYESSFFWHCQRMAYLDHGFASVIFPALILSLLNRKDQNDSAEKEINHMNKLITESFESVLKSISSAVKAISIIIDTLDALRRFSQDNFLSLKHKQNNKKIKKGGKGGNNVELEPLFPWEGLSFGIILHLDSIIVAEACMKVQRFASALFFLDMYFNSQFGKSGGVFEELNNTASCSDVIGYFNGSRDISGIHFPSEFQFSNEDDRKSAALRAISMTGKCYKELNENELMYATNMQLSSLNFIGRSNDLTLELDKLRGISALDTLQVLSFQSSQKSTIDHRLSLHMVESMEDLGLVDLVNTYIEGILVKNKKLRELTDVTEIREKWFENNLETQNWDMVIGRTSNDRNCVTDLTAHLLGETSNVGFSDSNPGFFESVSKALNSFSSSDTKSLVIFSNQARSCVVDSLSNLAAERLSASGFIRIVDQLRALKEVDRLVDGNIDLSRFDFDEVGMLEVSSKMRQITLTSLALKHPENQEIVDALKCHLWESSDSAINRGRPHVAESALSKLRYLSNLWKGGDSHIDTSENILRIRLEEAKIMECRGDFNGAIQRMKQLIRHILHDENSEDNNKCLLTDAQMLCGSWMRKYKTQQARVILESYLHPAADRAKHIFEAENVKVNAERATKASLELGHVVANLYDDLSSRIQSKEWKETEARFQRQYQQYLDSKEHCRELKAKYDRLKKGTAQKEETLQELSEMDNHCKSLERETQKWRKERDGIERSVPFYLNHALKAFLSALTTAGTGAKDLSSDMFRMVSLWFSSQNDVRNDANANDVMREGLCRIPSYRFVPLTNQLFSRVESCEVGNDQKFQKALHSLIFMMCNDHPYHCLVPLIALTNGKITGSAVGGRMSTYLENTGDSKIIGANNIIEKLSKSGKQFVKDLVESYMALTSTYNDLAHASTKKYQGSAQRRKKKIKFSEIFKSSSKKSLDRCLNRLAGVPCIITSPPMIRPGKDYGDGKEDPVGGERISSFESEFAITDSGIHRPKIVVCIGSQGGSYRQLVKGEDDIRQDAIMSQVFTYVNNLMKRRNTEKCSSEVLGSSKTVKRRTRHNLKMVTYNIHPLSPSSGVLEWVEGTLPIVDFLTDSTVSGRIGAHSRYYPDEWCYRLCRTHLESSSPERKRQSFDEICARFSPSFRFFFLEQFGDCMESWHTAKMNFTRSVAVSSIVGHILGIGDRHLGNILIHQGTGEVVHIDFGIVFEQGKLLPIPENVPFRLTANMIDGMGPCGTEGLFVKVAEETISMLRDNTRELLTILSAVVADPLYKWSVNPLEARQRQAEKGKEKGYKVKDRENDSKSDEKSQSATKTISKIKEKLQGYEDSTSGEQQGVEGQVQLLINSARDPNNLCTMFTGWGPWI